MTDTKSQNIAVRLPGELIRRLDAIAQDESARTGYDIGRAELIRAFLAKAATEHEAKHPRTPGEHEGQP